MNNAQEEDRGLDNKLFYDIIIKYLSSSKLEKDDIAKENSWIQPQASNYFLLDEVLYFDKRKPRKVIIEENTQNQILKDIHVQDGIHVGVKKMHEQIKKQYFWRYCYKTISQFVQDCHSCSVKQQEESRIPRSISNASSSPWTHLKFYRFSTPDIQTAKQHFIILFDPVSSWISAAAISSSPSSIAEFLFENIVNFGAFHSCTLYDVSQDLYDETILECAKITGNASPSPAEFQIFMASEDSDFRDDCLYSNVQLYLKQHPNDWWYRSTLLNWLYKMRNETKYGKSPLEVMSFMRKFKPARVKNSNAETNEQLFEPSNQLSEEIVASDNRDSASTAINLRTDLRRSIRHAKNILVEQPAISNRNPTMSTQSFLETVREAVAKNKETKTKNDRKKRGEYRRYSPETREAIAKHAIENGTGNAAKTFSCSLGFSVSFSTVRNFIRSYHAFSSQIKEEIGRYATECGVEPARKLYTEKLGKPISAAFIRKFRRLYLRMNRSSQSSNGATSTRQGKTVRNLYCTSVREEIGKYASVYGVQAAVRHFSEKLQFKVKESTVRKYKKLYPRSSDAAINSSQQQRTLPTTTQTAVQPSSQSSYQSEVPESNYYVQNYSHYSVAQYACQPTASYSVCASQHYAISQPVPPYPSYTTLPPPPQYQPSPAQLPAYSRHWNTSPGTQENPSESSQAPQAITAEGAIDNMPIPSTSGEARNGATSNMDANPSLVKNVRGSKKNISRGRYTSYSPQTRLEVGRFAAENGCNEAITHFKEILGHDIPESTIRTLRDKFVHRQRNSEENVVADVSQRGRPYRLGAYDGTVQEYLRQLKRSGEPVNVLVAITTARQVLLDKEPGLLEENGGPIKLTKYWAKSFLRRIGINKEAPRLELPPECLPE